MTFSCPSNLGLQREVIREVITWKEITSQGLKNSQGLYSLDTSKSFLLKREQQGSGSNISSTFIVELKYKILMYRNRLKLNCSPGEDVSLILQTTNNKNKPTTEELSDL